MQHRLFNAPNEMLGCNLRKRLFQKQISDSREGIACVEFAALAPVLVLITLSIIDICNVIHLKQKANTVAFETARVASFDDETFDSARLEGFGFAEARGLKNSIIVVESFEPATYPTRASLPLGFTLRAQVEVPVAGNVTGPFLLFRGTSIKSQLVRISAR